MLSKTNFELMNKHDTHFGGRQNIQRFFHPSSIGGVTGSSASMILLFTWVLPPRCGVPLLTGNYESTPEHSVYQFKLPFLNAFTGDISLNFSNPWFYREAK